MKAKRERFTEGWRRDSGRTKAIAGAEHGFDKSLLLQRHSLVLPLFINIRVVAKQAPVEIQKRVAVVASL